MTPRWPLTIAVFLALALPVGAAAEKDPVNITADQFVVDDTSRVATFTGQVVSCARTDSLGPQGRRRIWRGGPVEHQELCRQRRRAHQDRRSGRHR